MSTAGFIFLSLSSASELAPLVTSGLFTVELISGNMQVGNSNLVARYPACINIAGDWLDLDETTPTYASFRNVASVAPGLGQREPDKLGQKAIQTINRAGKVGTDSSKSTVPGVAYTYYEANTGHNIPEAFWNFLNQTGPVIENGQQRDSRLSDPWFYHSGLPVSDAYWVRAKIAGVEKDVLIQAFERRVLTYTPSNPQAFRVEMGNIGLHYYQWRYMDKGQCRDVGMCAVFPNNNVWNRKIDALPTVTMSDAYIASLVNITDTRTPAPLHPDFGQNPVSFQYTLVRDQPIVPINYSPQGFPTESDPGPYPVPTNAPIQGGPGADPMSDRHVFVVDADTCTLYELYKEFPQPSGSWTVDASAKFNLASNAARINLRPAPQTSADAAGLPMVPGFVRYDEITGGAIRHAMSFTSFKIRRLSSTDYVWPARHTDGRSQDPNAMPMGSRLRLKQSFDINAIVSDCIAYAQVPHRNYDIRDCQQIRIVLQALKEYGMILHDTGGLSTSTLGLAGTYSPYWNDDLLVNILKKVNARDFEVVNQDLLIDPQTGRDSMQTVP
jgi:hypothetical protein